MPPPGRGNGSDPELLDSPIGLFHYPSPGALLRLLGPSTVPAGPIARRGGGGIMPFSILVVAVVTAMGCNSII